SAPGSPLAAASVSVSGSGSGSSSEPRNSTSEIPTLPSVHCTRARRYRPAEFLVAATCPVQRDSASVRLEAAVRHDAGPDRALAPSVQRGGQPDFGSVSRGGEDDVRDASGQADRLRERDGVASAIKS